MKAHWIYLPIILLSLVVLVGCVQSGYLPEEIASHPPPTRTSTSAQKDSTLMVISTRVNPSTAVATPMQDVPLLTPADPALQTLAAQAASDLAEHLSVDPTQVELIEVRAVTWPDGALGCPQPGVAYIQVQREGSLIRLQVGKTIYQYHSGGGKEPFLCEHPAPFSGSSTPAPNPLDTK